MPLHSTVEDFWRLVRDQDVHTIIMLNDIDPDEEDSVCQIIFSVHACVILSDYLSLHRQFCWWIGNPHGYYVQPTMASDIQYRHV